MIETGVVLDAQGEALYWHLPVNRSGGSLPDSSELWNIFWENRNNISGFAHSHPGSGVPGPSRTDITTFAAVEAGLGKRLDWWITSNNHLVLIKYSGPKRLDYKITQVKMNPLWAQRLRELSEKEIKGEDNG